MNNSHIESAEMVLEANMNARKARHRKVFAGAETIVRRLPGLFGLNVGARAEGEKISKKISNTSPTIKLLKSYSAVVLTVFTIGAVSPGNAYSQDASYIPTLEGVEDYYGSDALMSADQDGYIPKINPQTELADRTIINGRLIHEVVSGDTLSTIAEEYGIKTNTLLWENGLSKESTLKIGEKLLVPPVDGVTHTVKKGQDIKKIASAYSISEDLIVKQNQLEASAVLNPGQELFIPGAKPLPVEIDRTTLDRAQSRTRILASGKVDKTNVGSNRLVSASEIGENASSSPSTGKSMIFPTRGVITQYFHPGHYAYDIADPSKPPVWAAMDGVVVKASSGTWGGGYGNHIIIDHGNGLKTLYGHMEYLSVQVGDTVTQGQVIGKMGRTGNVRGRTGIHVHFEVIQNGVKKSPGNYF